MTDFLFSGWLASFIISLFAFIIGLFITRPFIDYKICCYKIRHLSLNKEGSFASLHNLLDKCCMIKPDYFNNMDKFYKDLHFDSVNDDELTSDNVKRCMINMYINTKTTIFNKNEVFKC